MVCGLNGAGKSTLGKALAERLGVSWIDHEDLFFPQTGSAYRYASPRTRGEVKALLFHEMETQEHFVFAAVTGEYGAAFYPFFRYVIWMDAPREIRMRRVKARSFQRFGARMLPGGDLQEQEEAFFQKVRSRSERRVAEWLRHFCCPILKVDGTKPVEENLRLILGWIASQPPG